MSGPRLTLTRGTMGALIFGLVGFGIGQTVLFALLGPLAREIGLRAVQVGAVVTSSALVVVLVSPFWGRISDRWGRRPTLALGLAGYAVTTLLLVLVLHLGLTGAIGPMAAFLLMLGSRLLYAAMASAIQPSAAALVAEGTSAEGRTAGMAMVGGGFMLGTILGPLLGAALVSEGLLAPLLVTAGLALAGMLAVLLLVVPPPACSPQEARPPLRPTDRRLRSVLALGVLALTSIAIIQQTLSFFVQDLLALDAAAATRQVGLALAGFALVALATQAVLARRDIAPGRLLRAGAVLLLAGFLGLAASRGLAGVVASCMMLGLGYGMTMPGLQGAASLTVTTEEQGSAAGLLSAAMALGFVVGPLAGTALYQVMPRLPFMLGAALCLVLALGAWLGGRRAAMPDVMPS